MPCCFPKEDNNDGLDHAKTQLATTPFSPSLTQPHLICCMDVATNSLSLAHAVLALFLSWGIPLLTHSLWPERPKIRHYGKAMAYVLLVMWDIVVANIQVAAIILFRRNNSLQSCWLEIPLSVRSPEAITAFAGTITMTPGTVSCDLSADGRSLLVHCLDVSDQAEAIAGMKARYEARLQEIFHD